jgi:hypothetical protein
MSIDLDPEVLTRILPFPSHPLHERRVQLNGPPSGAFHDAGTIVPTLFGIQDQRGFAFFRIRDEYVHGANLYTPVASITNVRIKQDWPVGGGHIRIGIDFPFHFRLLLSSFREHK